jgi:predicted short-subunit dehydrogenase-like oxidoreductase (DUF2520 family)
VTKLPDISIIGPGKVGQTLGILACRAGWPVCAVAGRTLAGSRSGARAIHRAAATAVENAAAARPVPRALSPLDAARAGGLLLLTVPDDAIEPLCGTLAAAGAFRRGGIVAHCSGALGSDVLRPAERAGCHVGSLHPLATFPTVPAAVAVLPGTYCFIEGDAKAAGTLSRLARAIGAKPIRIGPGVKALYHAAACVASNYLVTLMDVALEIGQAAGIGSGEFLRALGPLVRATVENALSLGPAKALTGPIARGDVRTVERHLEAIGLAGRRGKGGADLAALYSTLAQRTVQLALRKGTLSPSAAEAMVRAIAKHP